jgi:TPR repeat protein
VTWRDVLVIGAATKSSQYEMGRAAYTARAPAGSTAKFDSSFRPELRASRETLDMLEAVAAGNARSQYDIGMLLAEGGDGVARDEEAAKRMFRLAAEGGFAAAAYLLAVHLPAEDPERVRWLRVAAVQGFAPAMRLLALALLRADATRDIAEVLVLLEKAAAQDEEDAMRDLATMYEKGIGVPRDAVKARVWSKRADAVSAKLAPGGTGE